MFDRVLNMPLRVLQTQWSSSEDTHRRFNAYKTSTRRHRRLHDVTDDFVYKRLIDVETTSGVYWVRSCPETFHLNDTLRNSNSLTENFHRLSKKTPGKPMLCEGILLV